MDNPRLWGANVMRGSALLLGVLSLFAVSHLAVAQWASDFTLPPGQALVLITPEGYGTRVSADNQVGTIFRSTVPNVMTEFAVVPNTNPTQWGARALIRVLMDDLTLTPTRFASFDMESHNGVNGDAPGYWYKTRADGGARHWPVTYQIGGHNLFRFDPDSGAMALTSQGGTGKFSYNFAGMSPGELTLGRNGLFLRGGTAGQNWNYPLIGTGPGNEVWIDPEGRGVVVGPNRVRLW